MSLFLVPGSLPYLAKVARMGQHVRTCQAPTSAIAHQVINNLTSLKALLQSSVKYFTDY